MDLRRDGRGAVRALTGAVTLTSVAALGSLGVAAFAAIEHAAVERHSQAAAPEVAAVAVHATPTPTPTATRAPHRHHHHRPHRLAPTAPAPAPAAPRVVVHHAAPKTVATSRPTTKAVPAKPTPAPRVVAKVPVAQPVAPSTAPSHTTSSGS